MISILPKLADRNFIVGFFVPALLAALLLVALFSDVPSIEKVLAALRTEKKWEEITALAAAVWVSAIVLMLLNYHLYRIAEGYTAPLSWLGIRRTTERRAWLFAERERLIKVEEGATSENDKTEAGKRIDDIDLKIAYAFPHASVPTLPTRFGNAIRAFESYATVVYGIDPIPAWPRLGAVMSKEYMAATSDAKAEVDFFLNLFFMLLLIVVLAAVRLAIAFCRCGVSCTSNDWIFYAMYVVVGAGLAYFAYQVAIWRAVAWGHLIKGAFDVYLPALAKSLGYRLPKTLAERREFWKAFSLMSSYFIPMDPSAYLAAAAPGEGEKGAPSDTKPAERPGPTEDTKEGPEGSQRDDETGSEPPRQSSSAGSA